MSDKEIFILKIKIPMKAMAAAATRKVTKSKENSAPDSILVKLTEINIRKVMKKGRKGGLPLNDLGHNKP